MRKIVTMAVVVTSCLVMLAAIGAAQDQGKMDEGKAKMGAAKQARWHGLIVRTNKDDSSLTVRRQNVERKIYYDGTTKWTRLNKPADMADFKEGADVICLGKYDESGKFRASRIDLRRD